MVSLYSELWHGNRHGVAQNNPFTKFAKQYNHSSKGQRYCMSIILNWWTMHFWFRFITKLSFFLSIKIKCQQQIVLSAYSSLRVHTIKIVGGWERQKQMKCYIMPEAFLRFGFGWWKYPLSLTCLKLRVTINVNCKLAGTAISKISSFERVVALKRAASVSTFPTVYSACLQYFKTRDFTHGRTHKFTVYI